MRIALRGLGIGMAEQLLDNIEADAPIHEIAGIRVAQIMQAQRLQPRAFAHAFPRVIERGRRPARFGAWEQPGTFPPTGQSGNERGRRRTQRNRPWPARFGQRNEQGIAFKVSATTLRLLADGTSTLTEVASGQSVVLARSAAATATTGFSETGVTAANPSGLSIASKNYVLDSDTGLTGNQTVFGDNLAVTLTNTAAATSVAANGNVLALSVAALGTSATVTGISTVATVSGNLQGINATLTSARGSTTAAATENVAGFVANVSTGVLDNVASISVSGSGTANINAGSIAATLAKLTSINLSGMTAFADQNILGQEVNGATVGGYNNLSTSTVTLNANIAETVTLGGARDTVVTGSTLAARDVITGFQLTASAADPLVADANRSDVLDLGTAGGTAFSASNAAKMTVTGSTIEAALLQASALKAADGITPVQNVVFAFGGNTYVYSDQGTEGLTDGDYLVQLSGALNLDLLITSGVIVG